MGGEIFKQFTQEPSPKSYALACLPSFVFMSSHCMSFISGTTSQTMLGTILDASQMPPSMHSAWGLMLVQR